jgi:gamma-glutamylcyclotransferase (GGCT)/AIG2-like uncharacterized protein YtfP
MLRIERTSWHRFGMGRGRVSPRAGSTTSGTLTRVPAIYFAYGSNLSPQRMLERVAGARGLGAARLAGRRLCFDKRGRDGTGKANLRDDPASSVWGALYSFEPEAWPQLDRCEPGYERIAVEVEWNGERRAAQTYVSTLFTPDPVPLARYKRLVIEGARFHALPDDWIRWLEAQPERSERPGRG